CLANGNRLLSQLESGVAHVIVRVTSRQPMDSFCREGELKRVQVGNWHDFRSHRLERRPDFERRRTAGDDEMARHPQVGRSKYKDSVETQDFPVVRCRRFIELESLSATAEGNCRSVDGRDRGGLRPQNPIAAGRTRYRRECEIPLAVQREGQGGAAGPDGPGASFIVARDVRVTEPFNRFGSGRGERDEERGRQQKKTDPPAHRHESTKGQGWALAVVRRGPMLKGLTLAEANQLLAAKLFYM